MQLGNFSVSLAVRDLQASKAFSEELGFATFMVLTGAATIVTGDAGRELPCLVVELPAEA